MTTPFRTASTAAVLLACSGTAFAVPCTLPSGPDIAQAKLSGPVPETYAVVRDSRTGVPCDVEPGTYVLQTFDHVARVEAERLRIGRWRDEWRDDAHTRQRDLRARQPDDEPQGCIATCPSGTQATGGACLAQFEVRAGGDDLEMPAVVPSGSLARETSHACLAMTNDSSGPLDVIQIDVSVHCE